MVAPAQNDMLARVPLLHGFAPEEVAEIAAALQYEETPPNVAIISERSATVCGLYFLLSGTAEVRKRGYDRRDHIITQLIGPTIFGEIEMMARRPAIASVVTCTDVMTAMLSTDVFDDMSASDRPCALKMTRNIARTLGCRLAATDERLAACFDLPDHSQVGWLRAAQATLYTGPSGDDR
jgi:CRP-like cAMP-binding protein